MFESESNTCHRKMSNSIDKTKKKLLFIHALICNSHFLLTQTHRNQVFILDVSLLEKIGMEIR